MRKYCLFAAILIVVGAVPSYAQTETGNGAISGSHYNLNLLGKVNCPGDDLKNTGRHTIFVLLNFTDSDANNIVGDVDPTTDVTLDKRNKIFLSAGDYAVTDGNACDSDGAAFTLPIPYSPECPDPNTCSATYAVFVRELGKPGGTGDIRTCGISAGADNVEGTADDELVCSSENVPLERKAGRSRFRNVTKELTTLVLLVDDDNDPTTPLVEVRIGLFDPLLYQYYWDYDNNGLRLVQMRFYPVS